MRVLLTGGYGCIGSWIVRTLLPDGHSLWIYDLKQDPHRLRLLLSDEQIAKVGFLEGDVTDLAALRTVIDKYEISHIVHLAALQIPACRANPLLGAKVNVLGTLAVLEAVRLAQRQVQRLVYASSAAVLGPPECYPPGPLADDVPLYPRSHYGAYKVCNEINARVYFEEHGVSSIGLRPWTVYGVGRDFGLTSEPTKATKALAMGRPYHISCGSTQDLQYAGDVARTFVRCLEAPYEGGKCYNIRGSPVAMPEFHRVLCKIDPAAERLITYGDRQIPIAPNVDDRALEQDLGPMPKTPLSDMVRQTWEQFRRLHGQGLLDPADLTG